MYTQFEEAGLIVGTEEWKEQQEKKSWAMLEQKGESDEDRKTDYRRTPLIGRLL